MRRPNWRLCIGFMIAVRLPVEARAQTALTWQEVRAKFEATNPSLQAARIGIDESKATEITAYLRPNPRSRSPTTRPVSLPVCRTTLLRTR